MTKARGRPAGTGKKLGITIPHDLDQLLDELAELTGKKKATLITGLLIEVKPHVQMTADCIKRLRDEQMTMNDARRYFFDVLADHNDSVTQAIRTINSD